MGYAPPRRPRPPGVTDPDAGAMVVEVALATLLLGVTVAIAVLCARSLSVLRVAEQRQTAVQIAVAATETTRAVPAGLLVLGRDRWRTAALRAAAGMDVRGSVAVFDADATPASTPLVPFSAAPVRVGTARYVVRTFIDRCYLHAGWCDAEPDGTALYRVTVDVQWDPGPGLRCPRLGCDYSVSTLRDPAIEPATAVPGGPTVVAAP
jgi:hypothetical protein